MTHEEYLRVQFDILKWYLCEGYYDGLNGGIDLIKGYIDRGNITPEQGQEAFSFLFARHGIPRDIDAGSEVGPADDQSAGEGFGGAGIGDPSDGDTSPGSPGSSSETDSGEEGAGGSESGDGDNEEWEKALNWLDL